MMTSTARESAITPEIGKYHLVAELARGGMGNVYLAATQGLGGFSKLLVVKELKPELADDETYVSMFLDEARLAARLSAEKYRLRGFDSIHLASFAEVAHRSGADATRFSSFDDRLNQAARKLTRTLERRGQD